MKKHLTVLLVMFMPLLCTAQDAFSLVGTWQTSKAGRAEPFT